MKKTALCTTAIMIMSINIYAENNQTISSVQNRENLQQPVNIKTVRGIMGENNPIEHAKGQLRTGYITFKEDGSERKSSFALGGHYHFDSKRWNGLEIGLSAYTVLNLGINQNPNHANPDFFDAEGKSFIQLTEAYLDGKWGSTEIKLGRQILDTPHADSDDIRMIPNYFEAYTITNNDIGNLTLSAGLIEKMAGWENGVDSRKFVDVGETLGSGKIDGIYYASALYEGIENLSLSLWYYRYTDIADVIYAEAGYAIAFSEQTSLTLGLQYDGSSQTGAALLGEQDANTYGASIEFAEESLGLHILAAYNRDTGNTGATGLSLGGGPFFTSMEDQTLDAIGSAGEAWMLGAGYHFKTIGIEGLNAGIAYGNFTADDASLYETREIDAVVEYRPNEMFALTFAYANIKDKIKPDGDYDQFRMLANYNF